MADIQLSSQLFQDIQQAVERQEPGADQGVVMQYLAAVMGYLLNKKAREAGIGTEIPVDWFTSVPEA